MKRKWLITATEIWVAGAVLIGSGCLTGGISVFDSLSQVVQAETSSQQTQQKINEVNQEVQELQQEKKDLASDLKEIENKKSTLTGYIKTLDKKVSNVTQKMEKNQNKINTTKGEIEKLTVEEAKVSEQMDQQYEMMKSRIKYIYEDGGEGYLELLLGSASLSDLYNRIEYVNKVNDYDKKMLDNYEATKVELSETREKKQIKKDKLEAVSETLAFEKQTVDQLLDKKQGQLEEYNSLISRSESELDQYNAEIQKKSEEVERLLAQQRKQIAAEEAAAAAAAAAAKNSDAGGGNTDAGQTPVNPGASASGFVWPLASAGRLSCGFGPRKAPTAGASTYHKGIDIAVPTGTAVRASKAGKVITATYSSSAGNYVAIYHGDGVYTYYMHCSSLSVSVGDQVEQGQTIALSGSTGISTGPHLHFAVNVGGQYVNPLNYVSM